MANKKNGKGRPQGAEQRPNEEIFKDKWDVVKRQFERAFNNVKSAQVNVKRDDNLKEEYVNTLEKVIVASQEAIKDIEKETEGYF